MKISLRKISKEKKNGLTTLKTCLRNCLRDTEYSHEFVEVFIQTCKFMILILIPLRVKIGPPK